MRITGVVFDLDGTLIDSAQGILSSFVGAFQRCDLQPSRPLTEDIIGPPLLATLRVLANSDDAQLLGQLAAAFKDTYDTKGYHDTRVYPHVESMLRSLQSAGLPLFIATNKRKVPTDLIIAQLDWRDVFQGVYSLDTPHPPSPNKGALIQHVMRAHGLEPATILYVGDREDDAIAAGHAGTPFFHATWGYEVGASTQTGSHAGDVARLLELLIKASN